jgi:ABC-2 type transport system ATP-binding protein
MSNGTAPALAAQTLGKRYRRGWALRDCTLTLPRGAIAALVGPNGAGKSTLVHLAAGLLEPTEGVVQVLGRPVRAAGPEAGVAFLSQDKPLYRRFTVDEMLRAARALNADWDSERAARLVDEARIPGRARIGTLSGGQRSRLALALALGRRPELLLLDEPLADLDPLARREVMQTLLAEVTDSGTTVLLSSHVLTDIEQSCDHLIVLAEGRVRLTGDIDDLVGGHRVLVGPAHQCDSHIPPAVAVHASRTARQATVLVDDPGLAPGPDWTGGTPTLEELVLAYLRTGGPAAGMREPA